LEYNHWEKRVDNGTIGEARTKELIIDRFWVLERSIDRDGADFLIQRKLTDISSIDPPRFGIIQSKFRESVKNIIDIKYEYVNDAFFLLVHTGNEDYKKVYFLKANDIKEFPIRDGLYKVKVLDNDYEVKSISAVLDEIEDGILHTEIERNQQFVKMYFSGSYYESLKLDENYELGFLDSYKLMSKVKDIKIKAFNIIEEVIDQISSLKLIVQEKNPLNLLNFYDTLYDTLDIDIDVDSISNSLKSYENDFKKFYYYQKDELYRYKKFLDKLGEKKLQLIRELKKIVIIELENEFQNQTIKSEDEIYSTGFDLSFELKNNISIKVNEIWTILNDNDYKSKSTIQCLNLIKNTNEINFCVDWSCYKGSDSNEFLLCNYDYELNNELLVKFAEFLIENY
jgi:hypothetical protein